MTIDLAKRVLQEGLATDVESALDIVYNSETYEKMCNEHTGLMYQNPGYVYCYLNDELTTGKL
ncbi:hypothetical protein HPS57_08930 [Prevotella sp. PINT]|nr:hypothetical protein [Palleniella intestinalis]